MFFKNLCFLVLDKLVALAFEGLMGYSNVLLFLLEIGGRVYERVSTEHTLEKCSAVDYAVAVTKSKAAQEKREALLQLEREKDEEKRRELEKKQQVNIVDEKYQVNSNSIFNLLHKSSGMFILLLLYTLIVCLIKSKNNSQSI